MSLDSELAERLIAGDETAWQHWAWRFRPVLARIARLEFRLTPEDTEDLLQELAVALLSRNGTQLRGYRGQASLLSWTCSVWRNLCLQSKRKQGAGKRSEANVLLLSAASAESRVFFGQAMGLASGHDRILLELHLVQGRSYAEIAQRMGISVNAVGPCLDRVRKRLRKILRTPARKT